jgi:hypothetical protein
MLVAVRETFLLLLSSPKRYVFLMIMIVQK